MRDIYKVEKEKKIKISPRVHPNMVRQLDKLKEELGLSKAVILENAVNDLYEKINNE